MIQETIIPVSSLEYLLSISTVKPLLTLQTPLYVTTFNRLCLPLGPSFPRVTLIRDIQLWQVSSNPEMLVLCNLPVRSDLPAELQEYSSVPFI